MIKISKLLSESDNQQFPITYSKIKPKQQIHDKVNNYTLEILSIETGKRRNLQLARIKNLQNDKIGLYSFPEIAVLVKQKLWEFI